MEICSAQEVVDPSCRCDLGLTEAGFLILVAGSGSGGLQSPQVPASLLLVFYMDRMIPPSLVSALS